MAAKFDQEALKKHHFWILLGVTVPLILIALIVIWASVSSAVADEQKKIKDAEGKVSKRDFKTKPYLDKLEVQKDVVAGQRGKVWEAAWRKQEGLMEFPGNPRNYFADPARYLYFGTDIDRDERERFAQKSPDYADAWAALPKLVEPTELAPNWNAANPQRTAWNPPIPSSEDIWLALEELCVEREVLENVRAANLAVARFEPADMALGLVYCGKDPDKSKNELFRRQFRNRLWELDLTMAQKSNREALFRGTMKNVSGQRIKVTQLGLLVRVSNLPNSPPLRVELKPEKLTEYVPAGETLTFKDATALLSGTVDGLLGADLLMAPQNVPVRRVELVALGAAGLSHRHADQIANLKMATFSEKLTAKPEGGAPDTGAASGGDDKRGGAPGAPGAPGAAAADDTSPNGFVRRRYLQRTDQVRRLPIRIDVLVDEAYIQDMLVALANSKLRLQITQVEWERARDVRLTGLEGPGSTGGSPAVGERGGRAGGGMQTDTPVAGGRPPGKPGGGGAVIGIPGMGGMPMPGRPGGAAPPGFPGFPGFGQGGSAAAQNFEEPPPATLVLLSVYGVASLYERYPPKAADANKPEEKK